MVVNKDVNVKDYKGYEETFKRAYKEAILKNKVVTANVVLDCSGYSLEDMENNLFMYCAYRQVCLGNNLVFS